MYKDFSHSGDKMRTAHNIKHEDIVEDVGRNILRIYANLDNRKTNYQSNMIEVEGKIDNQPIDILINSGDIHSYIEPNIV
jgi:hypothetical protein